MTRAQDFEANNSRAWELESLATADSDDTVKLATPSESGSEGVLLVLDPSSENTRVLQATAAFAKAGVNGTHNDSAINSQHGGQQRGGSLRGGTQRGGTQRGGFQRGGSQQGQQRGGMQQNGQQRRGQQRAGQQMRPQARDDENNRPRGSQSNANPSTPTSNPSSRRRFSPTAQGENNRYAPGAARVPRVSAPSMKSTKWATPPDIVTTRRSIQTTINAKRDAFEEKYIKGHDEDVDTIIYGYYLWPDNVQDPIDMFGLKLEDLDPIKLEHRVFIKWDANTKCVEVKTGRGPNAELNLPRALDEIRQYYKSAKARAQSAEPFYILTPPTAIGIRSVIRPVLYRQGLMMVEMSGPSLSRKEKDEWNVFRKKMVEENHTLLEYHLSTHILALAAHRGWMRMRVHFGHHNLPKYPRNFMTGGSFQRLREIMKMPQAQATGIFDKKLPHPKAAILMIKKILDWPERFDTLSGHGTLLGVQPEDCLCIFFQSTQGVPVRIEADIDRIDHYNGDSFTYQMGATRHYWHNRRNTHLEIVNIDIERKVDWALELITDNKIEQPDPSWTQLIQGSVTPATKPREDTFGAAYPDISLPPQYGIDIKSVVLRSTFQYKLVESGCIVEISIYRTWEGRDTRGEPTVETSVSMFHESWKWHLDATNEKRDWDAYLTPLFSNGTNDKNGIEAFFSEVGEIQSDLSDACRKYFDELEPVSTNT